MTNSLLFYLISSFMFLIIIWEAMDIFFVKKEVSFHLSAFAWVIFYIIEIIGTNYISIPILLLMFEIMSNLLLCMILYSGSLRKKLLWILFINFLGMVVESIVGYFFIFVDASVNDTQILGSFISKIILLMILVLLKIFTHARLKRDISIGYWLVLFLVPMGSIFVLNTLFLLCESSKERNASVMALLSSALILGINFLIFHIYEVLSDRLEIRRQQIIFNKQVELCKNQIAEREESDLNIRNIKHDIENHLICIREYIERNDMSFAKRYIEDLLSEDKYFKSNSYINSGNIVVDTLLNYKNSVMQDLGICMITHIEIPYDFEFNDADVCVILGNCIDNAIDAIKDIENSNQRHISLELIYRRNSLMLKISNPFYGNIVKDRHGNFITTKNEPENHGIGLTSVAKAVKRYNGLVDITTNNNIFCVQILMYSPRGKLQINS